MSVSDLKRAWRAALHAIPLAALLGCFEASDAGDGSQGGNDSGSGGHSGGMHAGAGGDPELTGGGGSGSGGAGSGGDSGQSGQAGHSGTHAGSGSSGSSGSAVDPEDGGADSEAGSGGSGEPTDYPRLEADQIGEPVSVVSGFTLAESPLWDHCGGQLLFTDVQGGSGEVGVIHTLSGSDELGVLMSGTTNANGIALDIDGSLVLSQMGGGGHLARRDRSGTVETIEPASSPNLHTPDDVIVRSDGTIYFSDGDFAPIGSLFGYASTLPVYILRPGATELENGGTVTGPNGIELSPDEKTLYVSAYGGDTVFRFAVADDGSLTKGDPLITGVTRPDSLCLDAAGNVYVGTRYGLQVVRPDGEEVAFVPIPGGSLTSGTTSCTFGGEEGTTLFITSWTTLYRVEDMPIPGQDWLVNRERAHCSP